MRKIFTHYHTLNKVGFLLSVLCTIHCLSMPILLTFLPYLGGSFLSEKSELYLVGASALLAIYLLLKDYKNHQNILPIFFLSIALFFNALGLFWVEASYEVFCNVIGALLMATAYWLNWNAHRRACHTHSH